MALLLTPDQVARGKSRIDTERVGRMRSMADEEERLVKSINQLRELEREERTATETHLAALRESAGREKEAIKGEIASLNQQRRELMKPIDAVREEAERRLETAKQAEEAVAAREVAVAAREREQDERETANQARETAIANREQEVAEREAHASDRERESEHARNTHAKEIATFQEYTRAENAAIESRKATVLERERACEIREGEIERRAAHYQEKDREIADRYATLERATKEILTKQHHG